MFPRVESLSYNGNRIRMNKLMKKYNFFLAVAFFISACGSETGNLVDTDLTRFSMPINIMAPADPNYEHMDGEINTLMIEKDSTYNLTIEKISVGELDKDLATAVKNAKELVELDTYFDSFVQEDEAGFIYKINVDGVEGYDFQYFRIMGGTKYTFKGTLGVFHTKENVEMMYKAIQSR